MPVIHDVPFNYDFSGALAHYSNDRTFGTYLTLRQEIFYDHRHQPKLENLYAEAKWSFKEWTLQTLKVQARQDGPLMLEYCLRRIALCTRVTRLPSSLLEDLKDLSGFFLGSDGSRPQNDDKLPELRIRAVAMLAWFFFRSYFRQPRPDSLHEMRVNPLVSHIVRSAYLCAVNDFLPPIIIRVASWFTSIQPFYGVDLRTLDTFSSRDSLWKAYEEYIQRQDALESKRLAKVASSPNWYRCAADGCGIQATNKGALRKCGGQCPTAVKPHYCSRECQEKHWFVHRYDCMAGTAVRTIPDDDNDPDWVDEGSYRPQYPSSPLSDGEVWRKNGGRELFIDITRISPYRQTEVFRIRSNNLSPAFLRSYRDIWQLPPRARKKMMAKLLRTPELLVESW